jgi:hypothetical protein
MTDNPLIGRVSTAHGRVTVDQIQAYADEMNTYRFVKANGWEYFVANGDDGKARLERRG